MTVVAEPFEIVCPDTTTIERAQWLELRKLGIGSSDAAPILGVSSWRSQYNVYAEKVGLIGESPDRPRLRGGRVYEEPTLRIWAEDADVPFDSIDRHLMVRSIEYPWMTANPDGLLPASVLEVKTAHSSTRSEWEVTVPATYVIQAHHLMIVTGRRECIVPVAFDWNGPVEHVVEWDDVLAESIIVIEREFWRRVCERDAPDPDGSESSMKALREQYREVTKAAVRMLPPSALELLEQREVALPIATAQTAIADDCKARIMAMLGDAEIGALPSEDGRPVVVVTWKANKNGVRSMLFMDRSA